MSKQQIDNKIAAVSSSSSSSFFYFFSSLLCIRTGDVRSLPQHMCVCACGYIYLMCALDPCWLKLYTHYYGIEVVVCDFNQKIFKIYNAHLLTMNDPKR